MVTSSISLHLSLSRPNFTVPLYKGVNDLAFFVDTRVEEETNQLSLILLLQLEYGMVPSSISLHLSLSRPNFAVPLYKGVSDFAFFVGT